MKQIFKQYAEYNFWANQQLMDALLQLSEEQMNQAVPSSFKTVYKTVLHMWDAESIWWQRLKLLENIIPPGSATYGRTEDVANGLLKQSQQWLEWMSNTNDTVLEHVLAYRNSKKQEFKQPIYLILMQIFNHATYHRGQLVNMMRQLGIERIPQTDFIFWSRGGK